MKMNFILVARGQGQKDVRTEKKNARSCVRFPRGCNVSTLGHRVRTQVHPPPCLSRERACLLYGRQEGRRLSQVLVLFASPREDLEMQMEIWISHGWKQSNSTLETTVSIYSALSSSCEPAGLYLLSRDCLNEPCQKKVIC